MTAITVPRSVPNLARILLCSAEPNRLYEFLGIVDDSALETDSAPTPDMALERLAQRTFDLCVVDIDWDTTSLVSLVRGIESLHSATQVLRVADSTEEMNGTGVPTVEVVSLSSPPSLVCKFVRSAVQKAKLQNENRVLRRQLQARVVGEIIGHSEAANHLRTSIQSAADEDSCVLIQGEVGTGAQHVARVIHFASRRAMRPFLLLDCKVHSAESLDHELWGETDSIAVEGETSGRLVSCAGGTLFLKSIETLPVAAQKKLAGILTRKCFVCPSSGKSRPLDVRLIASTHCDLAVLTQEERFHVGLYGHLTTAVVHVPALRERPQDIGPLTEQILNHLAVVEGKPVKRLSVEGLKALREHDWPANLRELENVVQRACSLDECSLLTAEMLRPWIAQSKSAPLEPSGLSLREMERKLIETTFARCCGNREQTARMLKIGIRTLSGKLREYGYPPRGGPGSNRRLSRAA